MTIPFKMPSPTIETSDALLMDVAALIQLSPSKHELAEGHFKALCKYVDRRGSPLQDKVVECYPGGSFATGTAILSQVKTQQHDVDVVMELSLPPHTKPSLALSLLFEAINGEEGIVCAMTLSARRS